jgi:hypothetical protein
VRESLNASTSAASADHSRRPGVSLNFTTVFVPQHALDTNLFIAGLAEEPVELVAPKTVQL